jgi:hypothetical protein
MGGIQSVIPADAVCLNQRINKVKTAITAETICIVASIPIISFEKSDNTNSKIVLHDFDQIRPTLNHTSALTFDELFWMCAQWLGVPKFPSWNGFMEAITDSQEYQRAHINYLPFVNLPPSSFDYINSVLIFAADESKKLGLKTCFVTFDQPLYIKARNIVEQSKFETQIVVRLGGFHLLMSFMGTIDYIIAESGLKELWNTIYAANSIEKMMN